MTSSVLGYDTKTGQRVELHKSSRSQGTYIIGATGAGKSGLIENLCYEDGKQGIGFCVIDPHGQLVDRVIARLPDNREKDVILLNIENEGFPFGLNMFTCSNPKSILAVQKVVDRVYHIFEKLLDVSQDTPLILEYLYNCTYTLIANPGYTMADIPLLLQDSQCRSKLIANVTDLDVQLFWKQHNQKKTADQNNDIASTLRRVKRFLQPVSRPIVGQSASTIPLPIIMDTGKILLVKLNVMQLEQVSHLIGALLIALFLNATDARTNRNLFNLYVDEFQRFATEDFATLLTEARKFGIGTTIAHQARHQPGMTDGIRATTLQAANLVVFRVPTDAEELARQFKADPKPGKTEYKPLYEPWGEKVKKRFWEPPEAEAEYKKVSEEKYRVQRYIRRMEELITEWNVFEIAGGVGMSNSYLPKYAENDVPASDERLFSEFYQYFNSLWFGGFNEIDSDITVREVFPSEEVKRTIRRHPYPDPEEKFFIVIDNRSRSRRVTPSGTEYVELEAKQNEEVVTNISKQIIAKPSLAQQLQTYRNYHLYVLKSIQDIMQAYRKDEIFYYLRSRDDEIRARANERISKIKKRRGWEKDIWMHTDFEPQYIEEMKQEDERLKRLGHHGFAYNLFDGGYWSMHAYPRLWEWFKQEYRRLKALFPPILEYLNQSYTYLTSEQERLRLCEKEIEEFIPKTYETATGEHHTNLFVKSEELRAKISHGYSETTRLGGKFPTSFARSTNISEERIPLHYPEPGDEEQRANAWNRIVEELVHQPDFVARVKMKIEENIGGGKQSRIVEHVIRTEKPAPGLYRQALQDRLDRIDQQNIRDGYIRPLQEVEAEITQRQTLYGQQVLQPPQPQPPPIGRKAASPCPSCGFSNPQGSKFCNQCGAKI